MPTKIATLLSVALALTIATAATADIDGDSFVSKTWRVRITSPRGWQISERSSYPNVLLWMTRRTPRGRMLLSAERLVDKQDVLDYAKRTAAKLERLGFRIRAPQLHSSTGAYWIDADNRTAFLRQAFLVANGTGYTLTLASESSRVRSQNLRAFESALRSIKVLAVDAIPTAAEDEEEDAPPAEPDAGPRAP